MNPSLLSSKTAASRRMLLLASPDTVDARDVDASVVDTSAENRSYMKDRLYGSFRSEKLRLGRNASTLIDLDSQS